MKQNILVLTFKMDKWTKLVLEMADTSGWKGSGFRIIIVSETWVLVVYRIFVGSLRHKAEGTVLNRPST